MKLPFKFTPRDYQLPVLDALDSGKLRAVCVWHRRAGKDKSVLNFMVKKMLERVGIYYYFTPTYTQGRKIIWDGIDKDGFKFLHHIPKQIIDRQQDQEMKIVLKNNSLFQVIGTDRIDAIVGTNPVGCVFSEYSLQNPLAWDYIRPILRENGGWAVFVYTPRGHNHGMELYNMAKMNPDWFCELLTIEDTGVMTKEDVAKEIAEGMDEDLAKQEYYCSFEGSMVGSYYGKQMTQALEEGRIANLAHDEGKKVITAWDLGIGDSTAIWFCQVFGKELHLIDYYEATGESLSHYIKILQEKGYIYSQHFAPHDIQQRELLAGRKRIDVARELGVHFITIPKLPVEEGIDAVRRILNKCYFDTEKTQQGRNCLQDYHKEYDERRMEFKQKPHHDWSSHGADAFRMLALGHREYYKSDDVSEDDKEVEYYHEHIEGGGMSSSNDPFEN